MKHGGIIINSRDCHGQTPLHLAMRKGSKTKVDALLSKDADPSALADYGQTPLDIVMERGDGELVDILRGVVG